jgi:FkbM family methyltransferase
LLETKFYLARQYRTKLGIPSERDFHALELFPDVDGALFLDIGANRGQSTDAILAISKKGQIRLFEPNPLLCDKLRHTFSGNTRITIHDFGLGETAMEAMLYIPFYKEWMFDGLASFCEENASTWLRGRIFGYNETFLKILEVKCEVKRLDEFNLDPFFIKLDVQGYEYSALLGGRETIRSHEPILLVESPDERTMQYLSELGYQHYCFSAGKFTAGVLGKPNTFFMTPTKSSLVKAHIQRPG